MEQSALRLELMTPERVEEMWPQLEPLFARACEGNLSPASADLTVADIRRLVAQDLVAVMAGSDDDGIATVIALQFHVTNGKKGVDVVAMAGRRLLEFKRAFWESILKWLKANGVQFVDAYTTPALAKLYINRFGFTESCAFVRMAL